MFKPAISKSLEAQIKAVVLSFAKMSADSTISLCLLHFIELIPNKWYLIQSYSSIHTNPKINNIFLKKPWKQLLKM